MKINLLRWMFYRFCESVISLLAEYDDTLTARQIIRREMMKEKFHA